MTGNFYRRQMLQICQEIFTFIRFVKMLFNPVASIHQTGLVKHFIMLNQRNFDYFQLHP